MPYLLIFVSFGATLVALFQDHFGDRFKPLCLTISIVLALAGLVFGVIEKKSDEDELRAAREYRDRAEEQRQALSLQLADVAKYFKDEVAERGESLSRSVPGVCLAVPADSAQPTWDSTACRVEDPMIYQRISEYSKLTQDLQELLEGAWQNLNGPTPLPPELQLEGSVPRELQLPVQDLQIQTPLNRSAINERLQGLFEQGSGTVLPELVVPDLESRP